ncbi:hypothetical protein ACFLVW_02645 [Chloroflexota bacterium]
MEEPKLEEAVEVLKEWFEEAVNIWETETSQLFPSTERGLYQQIAIEGFRKATNDKNRYNVIFRAATISTSIRLGFLPSEYYVSCEKAWSVFDSIDVPVGTPDDEVHKIYKEATKTHGEVNFWIGIDSASDFKWDESNSWLDRALEDKLLPRKMQLASLLLRAWCKVHLREYDEALTDLATITKDIKLRTIKGKQRVGSIKGLVEVLATCDISIEEDSKLVAILPDGEADEITLESGKQIPVPSAQLYERMEMCEESIDRLQQTIEPMNQKMEHILDTSPDGTHKRLLEECGGWVDKLEDPGLFFSAEAKYQKLRSGSWKVPIFEFTTVVESEIKKRLLQPFETFLSYRKIRDFKLIGRDGRSSYFKGNSTELFFAVLLFEQAESGILLNEFFSQPFIRLTFPQLKQIAQSLDELRRLYNNARHSVSDSESWSNKAERAHSLVLGTKDKPGILEQLVKIQFA